MKFKDTLKPQEVKKVTKEDIKEQIKIIEEIMPQDLKDRLETLAGVTESDYTYSERGIKFDFDNSQFANRCQIIEYHDKIIVEFRKEMDSIIEGTYNKLMSEEVIEKENLLEYFETKTGIYLSYI